MNGRRASGGLGLAALALVAKIAGGCSAASPKPAPLPEPHDLVAQLEPERQADAESELGSTRAITERERPVILGLMRAAERVRRLRFVRPVPVLVQDRAAIIAYARGQLDPAELQRARVTYGALGLLPPDLALPDLLLRLLGEQVVGYYDDRSDRLIVRDEVMRAFEGRRPLGESELAEARMTLIHELVHALQDQHLGLSERLRAPRDTDPANAFKALYEGDAMLAMAAFARDAPGWVPPGSTGVGRSTVPGTELERAPAIVRIPLLFAYLDGLSFAAHLFAQGGWSRVDDAYAAPPASTEQVLHPQTTPLAQRVETPRLPDAAHALGPDSRLLYEDTLGELELSVYFGQGGSEAASKRAASGWSGDRLYLYSMSGSEPAAVWVTHWDSAPDATEAAGAALRVRAAEAQRVRSWVVHEGRRVLIIRHATSAQVERVRLRFARSPHH